ncbi:hypothetical protein [Deinococcus sp. RL]|uniref:hypothetical protein n=1 Tax=Deinococcus sp. RL TaxID=1489678 RepID=UPI0013922519|nr:hypothetical protein [Deinococcus sp. RL]
MALSEGVGERTVPGLRIDHLLARGLTPTRTRVLPELGSAHLAPLAEDRATH